jgi:hypothetical protein
LALHAGEPVVEEQTGVGDVHALVHEPHVFESARLASHPSSGLAEQWAKPAAHDDAGTLQTPDWQVTPGSPGLTFSNPVQSCPQLPQFFGSDFRLTQVVLHVSALGAEQPKVQPKAPVAPAEQTGAAVLHDLPQPPQLRASWILVSQPSSAREEQWAKPDAHAVGGT